MKIALILLFILSSVGFVNAQESNSNDCDVAMVSDLKFSDLSEMEKLEALQSSINGDCHYKGIKLWGKVKFVTAFPDIKIQYVENFPDIKVKFVTAFADKCGLWQVVENFPDIKVQVVTAFPDIKVKVVENFPGVD
jgi:hypothetical protein